MKDMYKEPLIIAIGEPKLEFHTRCDSTYIERLGLNKSGDNLYTPEDLLNIKNALDIDQIIAGGSVTNTAMTLSALGRKSSLFGFQADDDYGLVNKTLHNYGITPWLSEAERLGKGNLLIIVNPATGERLFINTDYSGKEEFAPIFISRSQAEAIQKSDLIILEGYDWLLPQKEQIHKDVIKLRGCETKVALGLSDTSVINAKHTDLIPFIKNDVDLLFGNETEIDCLLSYAHKTDVSVLSATSEELAEALNKAFPNTIIFMSFGEQGAICFYYGTYTHMACEQIPSHKIISTNGAGDCFMAGVLDCYLKAQPNWIEQGLRKGTQLGTECIQSKTSVPGANDFIDTKNIAPHTHGTQNAPLEKVA